MKHDLIYSEQPARAFVLFRSGSRLDLLVHGALTKRRRALTIPIRQAMEFAFKRQ